MDDQRVSEMGEASLRRAIGDLCEEVAKLANSGGHMPDGSGIAGRVNRIRKALDGDDDIAAESRGNTTYAAIYGINGARVTIFAIRNIPAIRTPIATPVAYCDGEDQIDGVVENLKAWDN